MNSRHLAKRIVHFAEIEDEVVLEIGAGKGILTRQIAERAKKGFAVEIDKNLIKILQEKSFLNIEIINDDFLKLDLKNFNNPIIVGNIPYSITTQIFERLIKQRNYFKRAILTIQKEYGERILAKVNSRQYGSITLYINHYCHVKKGFVIPAKYFSPQPKVSSVVISLIKRKPPFTLKNDEAFFEFIRGIFCYRRKFLKNAILNSLHKIPDGIDENILKKRPENLTLDDYYQIYKIL